MADIRSKLDQMYSLEQISSEESPVHRLHPFVKLFMTFFYLVCLLSIPNGDLSRMAVFVFYPVIMISLMDIPYGLIFRRALIALPFVFMAGISNIIFDHSYAFSVGNFVIWGGVVTCIGLLFRTFLSVCAVLILVASTPLMRLTGELRRIHIPEMFVMLIEMIYRYISVLVEEASKMITAFRLTSGGRKWPTWKEFGPFVAHLFLRSTTRAEKVYAAMQCRLYGQNTAASEKNRMKVGDWIVLAGICLLMLLCRLVNVAQFLGGLWV